jgi:hypothetical protein
MKFNNIFRQKVPLIVLLFIWYYRIFGITFGGLVTKSGECIVNRKLKLLGNIFTISLMILYIIASRIVFGTRVFDQIYDSGFTVIYYSITTCREVKDILVVINLYYYQIKGFELFKHLMKYKLTKTKFNLLFLLMFTLHFAVQGFHALSYLTYFKMNIIFLNALFTIILNIFATMTVSAIHFITCGKRMIRFLVLDYYIFLIKNEKFI